MKASHIAFCSFAQVAQRFSHELLVAHACVVCLGSCGLHLLTCGVVWCCVAVFADLPLECRRAGETAQHY